MFEFRFKFSFHNRRRSEAWSTSYMYLGTETTRELRARTDGTIGTDSKTNWWPKFNCWRFWWEFCLCNNVQIGNCIQRWYWNPQWHHGETKRESTCRWNIRKIRIHVGHILIEDDPFIITCILFIFAFRLLNIFAHPFADKVSSITCQSCDFFRNICFRLLENSRHILPINHTASNKRKLGLFYIILFLQNFLSQIRKKVGNSDWRKVHVRR